MTRIAVAAYPLDWFDAWHEYEAKLVKWVEEASDNQADILVFPEYGTLELASLSGKAVAGDLQASIDAVSERMGEVDALHQRLAKEHGVYICGASASVRSLSLIHISEPTRLRRISYAVFCLKKKKKINPKKIPSIAPYISIQSY